MRRLLSPLIIFLLGLGALTWLASLPRPFTPVMSCFRKAAWDVPLLATMITGDAGIFAAYVWIPILAVMLWWGLGRERVALGALLGSGVFVFACGTDHLTDIITTFHPIYWFAAEKRLITGFISLSYAAALQFIWLPKIHEFVLKARADQEELKRRATEAEEARADATRALEGQQEALTQLQTLATELETARSEEAARATRAAQGELDARQHAADLADALKKNQELVAHLELQAEVIQQLGTTIIPVRRERPTVLVVPIQGMLDSGRMQRMQEQVAVRAGDEQADVVILDLTGVVAVDTAVAHCLLKTADILKAMGCQCILSGIRGAVAQSVVGLGVSLPNKTFAQLCDALAYAERSHCQAIQASRR